MTEPPTDWTEDYLRNRPQWFLVTIIYGGEFHWETSEATLAQECLYLVKATTFKDAYFRSLELSSPSQVVPNPNDRTKMVNLNRKGVIEVMPIWEPFSDGNELGYRDKIFQSEEEIMSSLISLDDIADKEKKP